MAFRDRLMASAAAAGLNTLAVAAFVVLALAGAHTAGYVLAGVTLAAAAACAWKLPGEQAGDPFLPTLLPQGLVATGLLVAYQAVGASTAGVIVTGVLLVVIIANQAILADTIGRPAIKVTNLPGYNAERRLVVPPRVVYAAPMLLIAALIGCVAAGVSIWPLAGVVAAATALTAVVGAQALRLRMSGVRAEREFREALRLFDPAFALHFSAPNNTDYHVTMWQPYLERIGRRWIIVAREQRSYAALAQLASPDVPVVFCPLIEHVDDVVTPGMKAVFYVNNGMKNSHMVRFNRLTHIQLLHGDSDKTSSYNPVTAMFDRIFVAGQAAIDRYAAHGVVISPEKFDIVGRPQVESIKVVGDDIARVASPVVLYATTWTAHYADANYSSLRIGEPIVAKLLERGATVILRPHPYADRTAAGSRHLARLQQMLSEDRDRTGRAHVFGAAATKQMSLIEGINRSDAMISDVSGVASDYLYSSKPFALTNMQGDSPDDFEAAFPLARAAYVIDGSDRDLDASLDKVLDNLLRDDPLADTRSQMRTYYLGDFPADTYADGFVTAARHYTA